MMREPLNHVDLGGRGPNGIIHARREAEGWHHPGRGGQRAASHQRDLPPKSPTPRAVGVFLRSVCPHPAHEPRRRGCHARPSTHDRMKRRRQAALEDGRRTSSAADRAEATEDQRPGEDLRLAAADHPLSRCRRIADRKREHHRGDDAAPARRQQRPDRGPESNGQRPPAEPPADPGRRLERQPGRQRAGEQIKYAMGIRRLEKEVAAPPGGIGRMPGLREIHRLVDVGDGPCTGSREHRRDQERFHGNAEPCRRSTPVAFVGHASHL